MAVFNRSAITYAAQALCTLSDEQRDAVLDYAEQYIERYAMTSPVSRRHLVSATIATGCNHALPDRFRIGDAPGAVGR